MAVTVRPHAAFRLNRTGESTDRSADSRVQSRPERLAQLGFEDLSTPTPGARERHLALRDHHDQRAKHRQNRIADRITEKAGPLGSRSRSSRQLVSRRTDRAHRGHFEA
jgi:hypothetical protein